MLLHYRPDRLGRGVTSLADSPAFFLSPDGKTDPQAELEATLAAFFDPDARLRDDERPACVYVARRRWLERQLGFDRARLPEPACPDFDEWRQALGARGLTLVFAESFMNNPASMFGHTLLRLDQAAAGDDRERRDLLAYVVNFAGETGAERGVLYAVKGIAGRYPGYFSLVPYYEKIKQYSDWESRDLWEYGLAISPDEVDRLLAHLWELRGVAFQYYFFDENCSYELLGLIEAARPALDLRGRFTGWVIPVDTLREVVRQAGLAGEVHYRPSATTRIRHLAGRLGKGDRRLARAVSDGRVAVDDPLLEALPAETRAGVLSLAHDHLAYAAEGEEREARARALRILTARSRVPVVGESAPPPATPTTRPDDGHETARLRVGGGWRDGRSFVELRLRPAFHDLLDPQGGFSEGAQVDFLDTALRYYPDDGEVKLHELTVIDIVSLAPRDELFEPVSWKIRTGLTTRLMPGSGDALREGKLWHTSGGAGLSWRPWSVALAYGFLEGTFDVSGKLEDDVALGAGARIGLLFGDARDRWRADLFARATRFFAGDTRTWLSVGLEQRLRLTRDTAFVLKLAGDRDFDETWLDAGLFLDLYF